MLQPDRQLSVITPALNALRFIDDCVANVAAQGPCVAEHIIVDGGSVDGTVERVEALQRRHAHLRLIRGPDRGQSDAMNKGTQAARGAVIGVLNVDDYYEPGACVAALAQLEQVGRPGMVVADCRVIDEHGNLKFWNRPVNLHVEALLLGWRYAQYPCNPSAYFYHREVHDLVGGYDVADHYAMDFDFILRCCQRVGMRYVPQHWGNFRLMPGCKTFEDDRGPERVAAIVGRHVGGLTPWGWMKVGLTKARIDFHRLRHAARPRAA